MEGYRYLVSFQLADIIYQLTVLFLQKYLYGRENLRYREQMEQAGRSGKQNIAEGYAQGTSLKSYIKLLGVAKGSLEELKLDFEDFLKRKGLEIWNKDHPKIQEYRKFRVSPPISPITPILLFLPKSPQEAANFMITIISQATFLLDRQIKSLLEKHKTEGGFTEKLYSTRVFFRNSQISQNTLAPKSFQSPKSSQKSQI